jgi:hypothetical protein
VQAVRVTSGADWKGERTVSRTTGPILATGLVTIANQTVFHSEPMDWRVPIATGLAAVGFSLAERAAPELAVILAWTTFSDCHAYPDES